jgi:hypothetical protein
MTEKKALSKEHDRFLFWLEGCKSPFAIDIRLCWDNGNSYTGEMGVNLRNKKREFERLNNAFKGKKS